MSMHKQFVDFYILNNIYCFCRWYHCCRV